MNKNSGISQANLRTKNMLESKKDLKDHKYGAAHRRMREAKKGLLMTKEKFKNETPDEWQNRVGQVWDEFGLDDKLERCKYLRHNGRSNNGKCNKKNDQNRRVPGYRKMKQNDFEKDRKKMEYRISRQDATFD